MKTPIALLLLTVCGVASAQTDEMPDFDRYDLETARAMAKQFYTVALDARVKTEEANKEVLELKSELGKLRIELARCRELLNRTQNEIRKLEEELAKWRPSNELASGFTPVITVAQLKSLGERYENKRVRLVGVTFMGVDQEVVSQLRMDPHFAQRMWIGLALADDDGNHFENAYAAKDKFGDMVATMKKGTPINIEGLVVELRLKGRYGLNCQKVERAVLKPSGP